MKEGILMNNCKIDGGGFLSFEGLTHISTKFKNPKIILKLNYPFSALKDPYKGTEYEIKKYDEFKEEHKQAKSIYLTGFTDRIIGTIWIAVADYGLFKKVKKDITDYEKGIEEKSG